MIDRIHSLSGDEDVETIPFKAREIESWRQKLFDYRTLRVSADYLQKVSLDFYLWVAVHQAAAIHEARDNSKRSWQSPAWDFGRFAKAHRELSGLDSGSALRKVKDAIGAGFWRDHLNMEPVDAEAAFEDIWTGCTSIPGHDPVMGAIAKAREKMDAGSTEFDLFLAVARHLQRLAGDKPIMLPVHLLAQRLGCLPMTISRFRKKAIRDGQVQVVKEHSYCAGGRGEATKFRYIGRSTDELRA